jgi:hypothetical protein
MIDFESKRNRYLKDSLPIRLGGLAANLARIDSFSNNIKHKESVSHLINECRYFIEWTTNDAEMDVQGELVELQIRLSICFNYWNKIWDDDSLRMGMAKESSQWSNHLLELAGFNKKR